MTKQNKLVVCLIQFRIYRWNAFTEITSRLKREKQEEKNFPNGGRKRKSRKIISHESKSLNHLSFYSVALELFIYVSLCTKKDLKMFVERKLGLPSSSPL